MPMRMRTPTTTVKCATTRLTTPPPSVGLSLEFVQAHHEGELAAWRPTKLRLLRRVLTSLSGNDDALELNTTTSFYQHMLGGHSKPSTTCWHQSWL